MKYFYFFSVSLLLITKAISAPPRALFSPYEGIKAFDEIYKNVENAKKTAHLTIYSWSDSGITKAMKKLLVENPSAKLRVVLHRPLARKESTLKKVAELEKLGAMFKKAKMNMHEKFVLVDSNKLINSSANMSGGAKKRYSEDFVLIYSEGEDDNEQIISSFNKEFAILWNTSDDIVSEGELYKADTLKLDIKSENKPLSSNPMSLISSSMNFNYSKYKETSANFKKGRVVKMRLKSNLVEKDYIVASNLIEAIDNAKKSIYMSVNHFNLYSVSQALIRAVERGIDVKLYVDNQEFKTNIRDTGRRSIEMTPRFVRDYNKLERFKDVPVPVRIKYYSHAPHHSYWYLNHHKYILIDYDKDDPTDTVLLSGSYNISKNAETKQFDNLVRYDSTDYKELFNDYAVNFYKNWNLNRTIYDAPSPEVLSKYTKIHKEKIIYLHAKTQDDSISLTWDEALDLKSSLGKVAPGIFRGLFRNKGCSGYNIATKSFFGGRDCKR